MSGLGNKVPWEENDNSKKEERSEGADELDIEAAPAAMELE